MLIRPGQVIFDFSVAGKQNLRALRAHNLDGLDDQPQVVAIQEEPHHLGHDEVDPQAVEDATRDGDSEKVENFYVHEGHLDCWVRWVWCLVILSYVEEDWRVEVSVFDVWVNTGQLGLAIERGRRIC